ncbi:MAG: extracellular solute-binding protein [Clostridia bacterium]|nr:extracellular solute-binding protein [Clostridia bacterium]
MNKRILAMLLAAASLAALSACGNKEEEVVNADGPLTYWCKLETVHRTSVSTLGDLPLYKELMARTGVEVEFTHPPAGQEQEQFNLMMSSRDYPDIIETNWTTRDGGAAKAISDKIIIPINDVVESSAPNYKKILEENANIKKAFTTDDGQMFGFGAVVRCPDITSGGLLIRRDMLEKLGMEMPDSIEDWETFLERAKNELGVQTPFTTDQHRMENYMLFINSFGIGPGFYIDENRQVKYGPSTPEYKEYLTVMSRWFEKGYLDNGLFSNTQSIAEAKILNDESAAFYGFIGSTIGRLMPSAKDESFDIIGVNWPNKTEGVEGTLYTSMILGDEGSKYGFSTTATAGVTTKNKNPEKTAKFFDYLYTEDGNLLKNFGIEGTTYNMVGDVPTYTDAITADPDGLPIADAMGKYFRATYPNPGFINDINYYNQYYAYDQQKETLEIFRNEFKTASASALPPVSLSIEEASEVSNIINTINTYKTEMFAKFMMGTASLDTYDEYVANLEGMGLSRVIEVYTEALARYDAR